MNFFIVSDPLSIPSQAAALYEAAVEDVPYMSLVVSKLPSNIPIMVTSMMIVSVVVPTVLSFIDSFFSKVGAKVTHRSKSD